MSSRKYWAFVISDPNKLGSCLGTNNIHVNMEQILGGSYPC